MSLWNSPSGQPIFLLLPSLPNHRLISVPFSILRTESENSTPSCDSSEEIVSRVVSFSSLDLFADLSIFFAAYSYYFCKHCPCKSLHWSFKDHRHCDECGHGQMQHVCLWNVSSSFSPTLLVFSSNVRTPFSPSQNEILNPIQKYGTVNGEGKYAWKKMKLLLDRMMLRRTKVSRSSSRRSWLSN